MPSEQLINEKIKNLISRKRDTEDSSFQFGWNSQKIKYFLLGKFIKLIENH